VHTQFSRRLTLIAIVFAQHRSNEGFPELPKRLAVKNPALVHPAYKCIDLAAHAHVPLRDANEGMASKLRRWRGGVNYPNGVQRKRPPVEVSWRCEDFHSCTKGGH